MSEEKTFVFPEGAGSGNSVDPNLLLAMNGASVGSSACQQMFGNCVLAEIDGSAVTLGATTLGASCYKQMFMDCAKMSGVPDLPANKAVNNCYEQMFWNVGNPSRGGSRATESSVALDASEASASNATTNMFAHYQGSPVQFHVPAGNPYGWITDSTGETTANKHLHTSFTIVDDL